ncbi:MAG: tetratricopeptide repeat protein [Planctomycetia bacterium]|nr:tetratricopeptide repeat protein [Planctomycetia bacterium]
MKSHPNFELLSEIGRGNLATVYRARDLALKRFVAVKEIHEHFQQDPRQMQQFWEEAQFLANLEHDNIVQIYALDQERGWIIMELMAGNLAARAAEGALPAPLVRSILRQCLEGLQFLHEQNRLHGAVKPSNLLISDKGRVKLSDPAGIPVGGEVRKPSGSQKYLAPELLNGEFGAIGPGVDLYCLGFSALELLVGPRFDSLFKGVGKDAVDPELGWLRLHGSRGERLPAAGELVPGLPPDLARVIDQLTAKEAGQRYASAAAALQDLEDRPLVLVEPPPSASATAAGSLIGGAVGDAEDGSTQPTISLPADFRNPLPPKPTPPTPAPAPFRPPPPARPAGASRTVPEPKPFSKDWINLKLKNPWILYPLCALILLPAIIFFLSEDEEPPAGGQLVKIVSDPAGATIFIDDRQQPQTTNAQLDLSPGKHRLRLVLDNHHVIEEDLEVKTSESPPEFRYALKRRSGSDPRPTGASTDKTTRPTGTTPPPVGRSYALLVGVRGYGKELPAFRFAESDMASLAAALGVGGFRADDVAVLTEARGTADTRWQPSAANLRKSLQTLLCGRNKADVVLVALAGQVVQFRNGDEAYFCPAGARLADRATLVPLAEIYREFEQSAAGAKVLWLDGSRIEGVAELAPLRAQEKATPEGAAVYFSAAAGERSYTFNDQRHGLFYAFIRDGLLGAADENQDQTVTLGELEKYVTRETVATARKEQQASQQPVLVGTASRALPLVSVDRSVAERWQRGRKALADGENGQAWDDFSAILKQHPGLVDAYLQRAVAAYHLDKLDEARADCERALKVDPATATACDYLGDILYRQERRKPKPDFTETLKNYDRAIQLDPDFAPTYNSRGLVRAAQRDFDQAIADYTRSLDLHDKTADVWFNRGLAYRTRNQGEDSVAAARDFDRALQLNPKDAQAYYQRGTILREQRKPAEAIKDFTEAIRLNERYAAAYNGRGLAYFDQKKFDDAMRDYDEAIKLSPRFAIAWNNRGVAKAADKKHDEAIEDFNQAIKLNERYAIAYLNRAKSYEAKGDKAQADADREKAKQLEAAPLP